MLPQIHAMCAVYHGEPDASACPSYSKLDSEHKDTTIKVNYARPFADRAVTYSFNFLLYINPICTLLLSLHLGAISW